MELEAENWRRSSENLVRGVILQSRKLRTGVYLVQLQYTEQSVELEAECSISMRSSLYVELEDENWRLSSTTQHAEQSVELEAKNWWKLRTV